MTKTAVHHDTAFARRHLRRLIERMDRHSLEPFRSPEQLWQWQVDYRKKLREGMRLDMPPVYRVPAASQRQARREGSHLFESFLLETQPYSFR